MVASAGISVTTNLADLRPEWERLWRRDPAATPFQSPAWLLAWWRFFGSGEPIVLTAHGGGGLVGLLPLYRLRERGCRKLLPIGVGLSDHVDPAAPEAAVLLLGAIADISDWDECWLPDLPGGGVLARAIGALRLHDRTVPAAPCPTLALPRDLAAWRRAIPRKTRRYLARADARAAAFGLVIETVGGDRIDTAMAELFALHSASWRARGLGGVLGEPRVRGFHRAAARALAADGVLRLYRLSLGGTALAVYYGFAAASGACGYLHGFDPAHADLAPGMQLIRHAIEMALAEGSASFDFLRGAERYKYSWGAVDAAKLSLRLTRGCTR